MPAEKPRALPAGQRRARPGAIAIGVVLGIPFGVIPAVCRNQLLDHFLRAIPLLGCRAWFGSARSRSSSISVWAAACSGGRRRHARAPALGAYTVDSLLTANWPLCLERAPPGPARPGARQRLPRPGHAATCSSMLESCCRLRPNRAGKALRTRPIAMRSATRSSRRSPLSAGPRRHPRRHGPDRDDLLVAVATRTSPRPSISHDHGVACSSRPSSSPTGHRHRLRDVASTLAHG